MMTRRTVAMLSPALDVTTYSEGQILSRLLGTDPANFPEAGLGPDSGCRRYAKNGLCWRSIGSRRSNGKATVSRQRRTLGSAASLQSGLGRTACRSLTWPPTFSPSC
jgi:hypothetical protein